MTTEQQILQVLATRDVEMYGLDLVEAGVRSWTGALYVALFRLEEKGLIESRNEDTQSLPAGYPARRLYRITEAGRAKLVPIVPPAKLL